jgi:hypothetical protein
MPRYLSPREECVKFKQWKQNFSTLPTKAMWSLAEARNGFVLAADQTSCAGTGFIHGVKIPARCWIILCGCSKMTGICADYPRDALPLKGRSLLPALRGEWAKRMCAARHWDLNLKPAKPKQGTVHD